MGIVKLRLERMYALLSAKEGCSFPKGSTLGGCDSRSADEKLSAKLSPISSTKMKALQDPTKSALTEYDKLMTSSEQSVQKAITLLNRTAMELQVAEEKELAKEKRLAQIRARQAKEKLDAMAAAKKAGEADAEAEASGDEEPGHVEPGEDDEPENSSESGGESDGDPANSLCILEVFKALLRCLGFKCVGC